MLAMFLFLFMVEAPQQPQIPTVAEIPGLLAQFASPNPGTRAAAFESVDKIPHIFDKPVAADAAVALLDQEDTNFFDVPPSESAALAAKLQGEFGPEGYGEYVGDVIEAVFGIAQRTDSPTAVHALLHAPLGPDSPVSSWLAQQGQVVAAELPAMAASPDYNARTAAVNEAGLMLRLDKQNPGSVVPPSQRAAIKALVVNGLKDTSINGTRLQAMNELSEIRDPGDQELVESVANSDSNAYRREYAKNLVEHWGARH